MMIKKRRVLNLLLPISLWVSVTGIASLTVTLLLGFESADNGLLWLSALCLSSAPLAAMVHLAATDDLTQVQKQLWVRALSGRRAPWALARYLQSAGRSVDPGAGSSRTATSNIRPRSP